MEFIFAALILGLAGSLHCIGMCGPLVMAVHSVKSDGAWWTRKLVYHFLEGCPCMRL
ncbi:MAG: sulfite exporter TauE/SafE family protein [Flavobacteriales bacterium]|nr:sulfite exporter TauE/SafE family protein [Flavobacteriales bacterium]